MQDLTNEGLRDGAPLPLSHDGEPPKTVLWFLEHSVQPLLPSCKSTPVNLLLNFSKDIRLRDQDQRWADRCGEGDLQWGAGLGRDRKCWKWDCLDVLFCFVLNKFRLLWELGGRRESGKEERLKVWYPLSLTLSGPSGRLGTKARPCQSFLCSAVLFASLFPRFRGQACGYHLGWGGV